MTHRGERKIVTGTTPTFFVLMPKMWSGAPSISFRRDGVEYVPGAFAELRIPDNITSLVNQTTLGTGGILAADGLQGPEWGLAFLDTAQNGVIPVQVERVDDINSQIVLSRPLQVVPTIDGVTTASLVWRWFSCTLPAAVAATNTGSTPATWRVTYTRDAGAAVGSISETFGGIIHAVDEVFDTGVSSDDLYRYLGPDVVQHLPTDALDWSGMLETAERRLVSYLRAQIQTTSTGRREDDLNGGQFVDAHLEWAASVILARIDPDESDRRETKAKEYAEQALRSVSWYDPDGDGIGETGQPGFTAAMFAGGSFTTTACRPINPWDYRQPPPRGS